MWDVRNSQVCGGGSCPDVSSQEGEEAMAGDSVKGGDYQTAGRMVLSARKRKRKQVMFTSKAGKGATYNFIRTRFAFSERATDRFSVVREAGG